MSISRSKVESCQKQDPRIPLYEVAYNNGKTIVYSNIDQINFDQAKRIVLVYPENSGKRIYIGNGKYATQDRRVVK